MPDIKLQWLLILLLLPSLAAAQNPLGGIAGTIRDQTGAVVSGATVTLINEATNLQQTTAANSEGVFIFPQLSPGSYTVKVEMTGFKPLANLRVKVDPGQEHSLSVWLEVGGVRDAIQVTAGASLIHATSPEINQTVAQRQILDLPLNGRNPIELVRLQAGVPGIINRARTAINGGRPPWTQVTQDGINIQDNFRRFNSLDFIPNRPTSDTIGEFTITTNTEGADASGGASQVKLITPSGGNDFHGSVFEYNRNSALAANEWFNNSSRVARPFLNRNQFGGRIGGPILKDRLFFFAYYEGLRQARGAVQNNTLPAHQDLLTGVFRYIPPGGNTIQSVNVLELAGLQLDPKVKRLILDRVRSAERINNFDVGDSRTDRLLNTAGFRFNQSVKTTRNQFGMRSDYQLNPEHHFSFTFTRSADADDVPNLDPVHSRPLEFEAVTAKLIVGAWHWTVSARLQNEVRIGANLAPIIVDTRDDYSSGVLFNVPLLTNPTANAQPFIRDLRSRHIIDNASYLTGNHSFQFGGSLQQIRVRTTNLEGYFPTVSFGFSSAAPANIQLTEAKFPGRSISAADLSNANTILAFLGGIISRVDQRFKPPDRNSAFEPGAGTGNTSLNDLAIYLQDNWRLRPNLTLRAGLKWEYFSPLEEDDDFSLVPVLSGRNVREVLLDPKGTIDFAQGGFYLKDLNNFGPAVGLAWDPFKDGKTAIRAGYTLAFVNDETVSVGSSSYVFANSGLEVRAGLANLYTTVSAGVPTVPIPTLKAPRTFADQLAENPTAQVFAADPHLRQPFVHEMSLSLERELPGDIALEGRYVSTRGRKLLRRIELNQINAGGAFLEDFLRARSNGFLALTAAGVFNPAYNANLPGSQPLNVIPNFGGGLLANSTVRTSIQQGEVGRLADFYLTNRVAGASAAFLPNPGIYSAALVLNGAETDYHAFQGEVRRRFKQGLFGQFNYTFSKALSNSAGATLSRNEPLLDNARPELEKSRAEFDITHIIHANVVYELPLGQGKEFLSGNHLLDRIVGGWVMASIIHWQGGAPFSILAPRATFNRPGLSGGNPANSNLNRDQIRGLFDLRKLPSGRVFYIDPAVTDPATGRAVGADNPVSTAGFNAQVFFNPTAGTLGTLQRLQFDGPAQFAWDFSLIKRTRIYERCETEFRVEFFSLLNHPNFTVGDQDVNSQQFGAAIINPNYTGARIIQLALKINF